MSLTVKWVEEHADDCPALKAVEGGDWMTPYWYPGGLVMRAIDGTDHKGGAYQFLVIKCNSFGCDAEVLVKVDDILVQVPNTR